MSLTQIDKTVAIDWFQKAIIEGGNISNYDNTSEPKIQAGSIIEVGQELYEKAAGEESITGWSGIGNGTQAYIYIVPSGSTATVIFSTTAPTWSDAKNGWYNGNNRALWLVYRTDATTYTNKQRFKKPGNLYTAVFEIGDWDMDANASGGISHTITDHTKIKSVVVTIRADAGETDSIFYFLSYLDASEVLEGGGVSAITSNQIALWRMTGGTFDSTVFDQTSYNRGWITMEYEL